MNISVYITSYNQKVYLKEAIDSVLAQTLPPGQIIIVDDCSSDGSQAMIEGYQSRYPDLITPLFHERNHGVAQARVSALQAVTGEYVTYVDGDDRFLPTKLEKEARLLSSVYPEVHIVYSNNYYITADGQRTATWITGESPPQGNVFKETLTRQFPRGNLYRMELLPYDLWKNVGFHDVSLDVFEDWEMRIRLSKFYRVAYNDEPLSEYRAYTGGLSNMEAARKTEAFEHIWRKNKPLIDDLSPTEQEAISKEMDKLHAQFVRVQAKEALGAYAQVQQINKLSAWDLYQKSWSYDRYLDWDLLLGMVLPNSFYRRLRRVARGYAGQGDGR